MNKIPAPLAAAGGALMIRAMNADLADGRMEYTQPGNKEDPYQFAIVSGHNPAWRIVVESIFPPSGCDAYVMDGDNIAHTELVFDPFNDNHLDAVVGAYALLHGIGKVIPMRPAKDDNADNAAPKHRRSKNDGRFVAVHHRRNGQE